MILEKLKQLIILQNRGSIYDDGIIRSVRLAVLLVAGVDLL